MSATPSILYQSRATTAAIAAGQPLPRYLLPDSCPESVRRYAVVFDQEFEQRLDQWPPAPRNTQSSAAAFGLSNDNAILTELATPQNTWAGNGKFRCTFAVVPATWDDFKTQAVTFPGWINTVASGLARVSLTLNVTVRLHYEYFVLDTDGVLASAGVVDSGGSAITRVASIGAIPFTSRALWLNTLSSTPQVNSTVNDLVPSAGATVGTTTYIKTYPAREEYATWISNAATALASNPWNESYPTKWDKLTSGSNISSAGQYQFSDSSLREYSGQIIERCTPYAIPQ